MLLRIEDIDPTRSRPEFYPAIEEDLAWLGIRWDGPVRRQSRHLDDYRAALRNLIDAGVTYPCFCTRREIAEEVARSGEAQHGPDGPRYPGTCRALPADEARSRVSAGEPYAVRLDAHAAAQIAGRLEWNERGEGKVRADPLAHGDFVVARKETPTSYHLSVVVDDALQGVTLVTRGRDLREATHAQRLLQALLGLPAPEYLHHRLVLDPDGRRLAKRDGPESLQNLREAGWTVGDVWAAVAEALEPERP
jgi:glutamyl-Q tRNA(Asp) synthetase